MDEVQTVPLELQTQILELQNAILSRHPSMPTLLRQVHTALRKQPENVILLSEEDIGIIVNGLEAQTNTFLAETVTKGAKSTSKVASVKKLGADAF